MRSVSCVWPFSFEIDAVVLWHQNSNFESVELFSSHFSVTFSANKGLPLPLGRGVCETKSKNGRSRPRKPSISRVFCRQRGIETMVSDHGLGRGQTMG